MRAQTRSRVAVGLLAAGIVAVGCGGGDDPVPEDGGSRAAGGGAPTELAGRGNQRYGLTAHRADGNRLAAGRGSIPGSEPLEAELGAMPQRVVAARSGDGPPLLAATLPDGSVQGFRVSGGELAETPIPGGPLRQDEPPLLDAKGRGGAGPELVRIPGASPVAGAVARGDWLLAVGGRGELLGPDVMPGSASIAAPPDSRPAIGDDVAIAIGGATERYDHGVLGDAIEGSELFAIGPGGEVASAVTIGPPAVIEGSAPILAQLGGGPAPEAIVTVSDADDGAQLAAYELGSTTSWSSDPIGQGMRWRHQIAVAPFGPEGELELASVLTPHLDGTVEFHAIEGDELLLRASLPGYSSHELGSRNLDRAIAGDFDGSGRPELVVPLLDGGALVGIERTADGAEEVWRLQFDAPLATNLAAVTGRSGSLLLAAGLADGSLLVWGANR